MQHGDLGVEHIQGFCKAFNRDRVLSTPGQVEMDENHAHGGKVFLST